MNIFNFSFKKAINTIKEPEDKISSGFSLISQYRSQIMGAAALLILYFHVFTKVIPQEYSIPHFIESRFKRFGYCGVDIFFFLSGMGLTYAVAKSKLYVFYYRRIKRLILPFLTVAVLKAHTSDWSIKWFFECISGKAFYCNSIYSFLWFVPAILTLYIIFPLYWLGLKKTGPWFWTGLMLVIWLFVILIYENDIRPDMFGFLNRLPVFMLGVLTGHLSKTLKNVPFRRRYYLLIFIVFALGVYLLEVTNFRSYFMIVPSSNCFLPTLLVAVSFPFLLAKSLNILDSHRYTCIPGHILGGLLKFFGLFSMELYCFQEWFSGLIKPYFEEKGFSAVLINVILFAEITVMSFIAYLIFSFFWRFTEFIFGLVKKRFVRGSAQ